MFNRENSGPRTKEKFALGLLPRACLTVTVLRFWARGLLCEGTSQLNPAEKNHQLKPAKKVLAEFPGVKPAAATAQALYLS